ncbi:hypothetical protein BS50DRAFT_180612 [Corynespora cassiicola Philippines]|uniref:Secreted protein n=1 Tax=Corynespora cassiicola Philippines TaxID=1448308 RepID=A0A2T2P637_CORCC|nr:hypothetical protein BS50DRAFT_180612 [Corynespora cassiicola Philippines]
MGMRGPGLALPSWWVGLHIRIAAASIGGVTCSNNNLLTKPSPGSSTIMSPIVIVNLLRRNYKVTVLLKSHCVSFI